MVIEHPFETSVVSPDSLISKTPSPRLTFFTRAGLYPHLGHDALPHDEPRRDVASVRDGVAARAD